VKTVRILVADDHEVVRRGVRGLVESRPDWIVCGEATNGREAVEQAGRLAPDVVILDIAMPELNGLEAARRIHKAAPRTEVLILTMHRSEELVRQVLAAGARGYLLKSDAGRDLLAAVDAVAGHRPFFTPRVASSPAASAKSFSSWPRERATRKSRPDWASRRRRWRPTGPTSCGNSATTA